VAQLGQRRGGALGPPRRDRVEHLQVVEVLEAGHRHQQAGARLAQDMLELALAVAEVERHGDSAGPGDRELQGHELGVVGHHDGHAVTRADPQRREAGGLTGGQRVDLRIAQRRRIGDHEGPFGVCGGGGREAVAERHRRPRGVAIFQRGAASGEVHLQPE
jgi:hypothetical protein